MDITKFTRQQLVDAIAKIDGLPVIEEPTEVIEHKHIVATRDKDGNAVIFRVAEDTIEKAAEEVRSAMIDSGVKNPLVLSLIIGGKSDIVVPCEPMVPIEPELA